MNKQIKALNEKLATIEEDASEIEAQLQAEWNEVFEDMTQLRDAVSQLEQSNQYSHNTYGEICSWVRFDTSDFKDCGEFLKEYLRESYCIDLDFDGDTLTMSHGDDNLVIQSDSRQNRDNGVWQDHKLIIAESDYKNEDGEIDETKRNELIELHMQKSDYFPGVFRVDYHGNIFPVSTAKKGN